MIPLDGSGAYAVGGVADTRSNSAPVHLLTPRPVPVPVVAVSTPSCNAARDSPAPAVRVQRRPSCGSGCYPVNMPASPLPTARAPPQRRPSSPHQAPAPLSLAPSNASFAPQQRLLAAMSGGGSERASPLRTQGHIQSAQGHVQSAPCIAGTPPPTARMGGSQVHFGQVLGQIQNQDLIAKAAQKLQFQSAMPTARTGPVRCGAVPAHVLRSPRIAG
jgi:hypothetical protein